MQQKSTNKKICAVALTIALATTPQITTAQNSVSDLDKKIEEYEQAIKNLNQQEKTLQNEIQIIETEIEKTQTEISSTNKKIQKLIESITEVEKNIQNTQENINEQAGILKTYLQFLDQNDKITLLQVVFSSKTLTDFLNNIEYTKTLQDQTRQSLTTLKELQTRLQERKKELEALQEENEILLNLLENQNQELIAQKQAQQELLAQTQGEEEKFQELFKNAKQERQTLLIQLLQTQNNSGAISIEDAKQYANFAESKTGVRASITMAIIEQESYFGSNVGTGNYKTDMKPTLHSYFLTVCEQLGINPDTTPVSKKPVSYQGWGGAMGPAQIMPPTWLNIKDEVARLTGNPSPNPWNPQDAFMGAAVLLRDRGVTNPEKELEAIGRYFAGSYWRRFTWYAESVLRKAKKYE